MTDSPEFKAHLAEIGEAQNKNIMQLVNKSTEYLRQVAPELARVHKECRDAFQERFAELESIVPNPVDFAKVVRIINESPDLSTNLKWLPNTTVLSITVAFSASPGTALGPT